MIALLKWAGLFIVLTLAIGAGLFFYSPALLVDTVDRIASRADAMSACRIVQSRRGQCFVREAAPGATPQRWAVASKGRQYASR